MTIIYPVDENGKPVGPPLAPNTDGTVTITESGVYYVEQHFSDAGKADRCQRCGVTGPDVQQASEQDKRLFCGACLRLMSTPGVFGG